MANFYEDQAKQRFQRAKAFVDKAHGLMLQEDLVSRSALDDAVSAVKNSLQGYLMYQIANAPAGSPRRDWPDVAASNRMPDLIRACQEAGLSLTGLDGEIRKLNDERNSRTHDDPLRVVETLQARQAVEVALMVQRRIAESLKRSGVSGILTAPAPPAEAAALPKTGAGRGVAPARASGAAALLLRVPASGETPAPPTSNAPGRNAVGPSESARDLTEDEEDDIGGAARRAEQIWARRRAMTLLTRAVAALVLIVAGALGGAVFASTAGESSLALFTAGRGGNTPAIATATLLPANAAYTAGALLANAPVCQATRSAIPLRNLGATALPYTIGSPDASDAIFALAPDAPGQPAITGALPAGGAVTVYARSAAARYHIVVIGQAGTIQLPAGAC